MDTLIKADIFFFITSIAVIIATIIGAFILFYILKIARIVSQITELIKEESENMIEDIARMRENVKTQTEKFGGFMGGIINLITSSIFGKMTQAKRASRAKYSKKKAGGERVRREMDVDSEVDDSDGVADEE